MNSYSAITKVPGNSSKISWQHHKAKEFQNPSCPPRLDQPKFSNHRHPTTNYFPKPRIQQKYLNQNLHVNQIQKKNIQLYLHKNSKLINFKEYPLQENERPTSKYVSLNTSVPELIEPTALSSEVTAETTLLNL